MPGSERRDREKVVVRGRILAAALQLLETEGAPGVTMRRVAEAVDYTAPIIYQHFANKDALIGELVRQGYDELVRRLETASHDADIDARLAAAASEYLRFAGENAHLFEAMNGTALGAAERRAAAESVIGVLSKLIDDWAETHQVTLEVPQAYEIIWGTLYGIAALGRLESIGQARARRLGVNALRLLLSGWRSIS
ncbi:AcrR family transcriptional regulator [Microbacterium halimionae]|uniref:AcrR family transcriptional regulator n=1 Tax=Microbacterium halimionae TaxID=1526413 RepID=A0A7W3JMF9_9MICO|nr:TetR/AcrR family transcriptional regulator [Microbacterium halimionae]MBA8815552.1 AcrR family transcriptional regulator [Microbacterium halimionae]NII95599.1 AcrR family transcriptional regulator [Microbacterium halimionae]